MPTIRTKYKCGDNVSYDNIHGKVTAVFIRGRGRSYEFSYVNKDGDPTSNHVEECELELFTPRVMGFGK